MCRVLNKHHAGVPADAVYVGRGSKWGNPFRIGAAAARERDAGCADRLVVARQGRCLRARLCRSRSHEMQGGEQKKENPAAACPAGASRVKLRPRSAALDPSDRRGGRPRGVTKD
jgi:hypothetical protein